MFGTQRVGGISKVSINIDNVIQSYYVYGEPMSISWKLHNDGIDGFLIENSGALEMNEPIWELVDLRAYLADEFFQDTELAVKLKKNV